MSCLPLVIRRKHKDIPLPVRLALIISLSLVLGMNIQVSPVYPAQHRHAHARAAYTISGTVFDDYNQNGSQDTREPGLNGALVTAYNSANAVVTSTSTATNGSTVGQYALSIPDGTGPVRIQFSNFGASTTVAQLKGYQPSSHTGGTTVAFVDGSQASTTVNQALAYPSDYCQNNPNIAINCYTFGSFSDPANTTAHVVVRFPYNSSGNETSTTALANMPEVGTTWGMAYRHSSDTLFMASYMKRHSGLGSGGPGAIYLLNGANSGSPSVSAAPFATLSAGTDLRTGATDYRVDNSAYDLVGKMALGGMALSDDLTTLYVMNLADKKLYSIGVDGSSGPPTAGTLSSTALPSVANCSNSDMRPFAVTSYHGTVYVGVVCSAESTVTVSAPRGDPTQLYAYVFSFTPGSGFTSTPVFQTALNYKRGCVEGWNCGNSPATWQPWNGNFSAANNSGGDPAGVFFPQPILSSIAFDRGDLILGIRDRFGDQVGNKVLSPSGGTTEYASFSSGDIVRACLATAGDLTSGWILENNAVCGGTQTAGSNNGQGPGNGEYYYQDGFPTDGGIHQDVNEGGVLQVPGFPGVLSAVIDPTNNVYSGGTHTYDNVTGAKTNAYEIFHTTTFGIPGTTFGKANGLGSLATFCQAAPIEIGNRVWNDLNGNGIQDPGEAPIAGVTVHLYDATGTSLVASTVTDANGEYAFPITVNTSYVIKLDNAADYSSGPLKNFQLTSANQDSSAHVADSKAALPTPASAIGAGNYPQIAVGAHTPGQNDYSLDIGFTPLPDLSLTKTNQGGSSFYQGQTITYTLTAHSNAGPIVAGQPITVTDTLPAGLDNVSINAPNWQISATPALNRSLARSQHLRHPAHLLAAPQQPLRKSTTHATGTMLHPTTVDDKHGLHTSLIKLGSISSPLTITATYSGTYPVTPGTDLPPITISGTFNASAVPSVNNSASVSTTGDFNASNNSASDMTTVALAPDLALTISHPGSGCAPLGQSVSYTIAVSNGSSAGAVPTGQSITVSDTLPAGLSNVSITGGSNWSIVPTSTTFTATYVGTLPVAPGTQLTPITITGTVSASAATTQMSDSATVQTALDINATNDSASDSITACAAPDLAIVKTQAGNNPFHIGQQVTFSLAVSNGASAGPVAAGQPITITDTLPAGLSNISTAGGSDWTITLSGSALTATYKGSYPIATGAKLGTITVTGTLTSTAVPSLANTATVSTPLDTNTTNNSSTDTLTVDTLPDLGITLTHTGSGCTKVGASVSYTVQVTNAASAGPVPVGQSITVSDPLPAELSNITYNGGADWTISISGSTLTATYKGSMPVPPGTAMTPITITGTLTNPSTLSVSNSATVSTPLDTNASNDSSTDTLTVCPPDLTVGISHAGGSTMQVGQSVTYTITSQNLPTAGPVVAGQPISLSVTLPPGLTTISSQGSNWQITTASSASGTTITAIYIGSSPVLSGAQLPPIIVSGTLTEASVPSYTASAVIKTPQDTNASNDTMSDPITVLPLPDLSIALLHQGSSCFQLGQQVTYTMTVSNAQSAGPLGANHPITVTNTLPGGLSNVQVTANGGDWLVSSNGSTITATYTGSYPVAAGAQLSPITITATLDNQAQTQMLDTATVSTPQDTNAANNSASDSFTMCAPDLAITKTNTGGSSFLVGQQVTYTLRVSNATDAGAVLRGDPITVTDIAPVGLSNVSAPSTSDWAITLAPSSAGTSITATYTGPAPVLAGATLSDILISGTLTSAAVPSLVNSATVSTPHEGNPANDTAIDTITVSPLPDLSVTLAHTDTVCRHPGDTATYTITVKNAEKAGAVQAGDFLTVTNYIPGGLEGVVMQGGSDWTISQDGTKLVATYKGAYPVPAGATLFPITMTGIITAPPAGRVDNTVRVDTPRDGNTDNNVSGDTFWLCQASALPPTATPTPPRPPFLLFSKTHLGGNSFNVGDSITYILTVRDRADAGPVPEGMPIVVTDNVPAGLSDVTADGGTDWQITITSTTKGTVVKARYIGLYPIEPGTTLTQVRVTGTINDLAVGGFVNGASVNVPGEGNAGNKKDTSTIIVKPKPGSGHGPGTPGGGPPRGGPPGLPPTGSDPLGSAAEREAPGTNSRDLSPA